MSLCRFPPTECWLEILHLSPLLTFSELGLLGEVEWEAEPDDELEFNDQFMLAAAEKPAFLPLKAYSKLPLPLRMPSNIFEYSRHFFHKHAKHHHHQSSSLGHNRVSLQSSKIHNQGPLFSIKKLVLQRHDLAWSSFYACGYLMYPTT